MIDIKLENLIEMVDIEAAALCEIFDSTELALRDPWEIQNLRKNGAKIGSYEKSVWGEKLDRPELNFMFYKDEFMEIMVGFSPTAAGGIERCMVAIQRTDGTDDNEGELVYFWDRRDPERRYCVTAGEDWRERLSRTANAAQYLHRAFFTGNH